jgi:hypothetical protein
MLNTSRNWLIKLLRECELPASSLPKTAKADIANVLSLGFIVWVKSGAGGKYTVKDAPSIQDLLDTTGYDGDIEALSSKAKAVALHGNAHRGKDNSLLLLLSSASAHVIWTNGKESLNVTDHVAKYGIASLLVYPGDNWITNQPIALVENQDLVFNARNYFERMDIEGCVLYYSGWLSNKLLCWLNEKTRAPSYLIMPDYDLVGIKNYLRAKQSLGDIVDIYIPSNLAMMIKKYGDAKKLESMTDRTAIETSEDKKALELYRLLLDCGKGIDQESLMLYNQ